MTTLAIKNIKLIGCEQPSNILIRDAVISDILTPNQPCLKRKSNNVY